jgi:hypothetical protein
VAHYKLSFKTKEVLVLHPLLLSILSLLAVALVDKCGVAAALVDTEQLTGFR